MSLNSSEAQTILCHHPHFPLIDNSSQLQHYAFAMVIFPSVFYLLVVLGCLGNMLELVLFFKSLPKVSSAHYFSTNLAMTDLLYLISVPAWGYYLKNNYNWYLGEILCKMMFLTANIGLSGSTFFTCLISVDRYFAIVHPLQYVSFNSLGKRVLMAGVAWGLVIYSSITGLDHTLFHQHGEKQFYCGTSFSPAITFLSLIESSVGLSLVQIVLAVILILTCYIAIIRNLKKSSLSRSRKVFRGKTMKRLFAVLTSFLLCWLPSQLLQIICYLLYISTPKCQGWMKVINLITEVTTVLNLLNSGIDPFLYRAYFKNYTIFLRSCCSLIPMAFATNLSQHRMFRAPSDTIYYVQNELQFFSAVTTRL